MKQISIEIDATVSVDFFVAVVRLMEKKFGKKIVVPIDRMELIRRAAAVIEVIGEECRSVSV